ncbi:hypothetical protein [Rheinheimera sp. 1928-s]|uniref:hypothetical protein n=1 Tax=Rheinheimera sp. 1928-s TaxID=3033803 RepID=UPI00262CA31D|nr:hypothetical protein [Rheinheimera sp. 1928-s]MDF3123518.1 hypothetical protein [Rheinheimera sp. 1928-s]
MSEDGNTTTNIGFRLPKFDSNFSCIWVPIYLEPITHSGEKITIGFGFRTIDGELFVKRAISELSIVSIFGEKGKELYRLTEMVLNDFERYLIRTKRFNTYEPKIRGVTIGQEFESVDDNIEQVINQAKRNLSVFSLLDTKSLLDVKEYSDSNSKSWQQEIMNKLNLLRPTLLNHFNREVIFRKSAKPAKIGYVGTNLAFNFGVLNPQSTSFAQQQNKIMRYATELNSMKKLGLSTFNHLEVNVWIPEKNMSSIKKSDKLYAVCQEIEHLGDDIDVRIEFGQNIDRVTKMIIDDVTAPM